MTRNVKVSLSCQEFKNLDNCPFSFLAFKFDPLFGWGTVLSLSVLMLSVLQALSVFILPVFLTLSVFVLSVCLLLLSAAVLFTSDNFYGSSDLSWLVELGLYYSLFGDGLFRQG